MRRYISIFILFTAFIYPLFSEAQIITPNQSKQSISELDKTRTERAQAFELYRNKEYDKALVIFEKLYKTNPQTSNYNYYLSCLKILNENKKAERLIKKMIRKNPGQLRLNIDLGQLYNSLGKVKEAEKEYRNAIDKLPADQRIISNTANGFLLYSRFNNALEAYQKGKQLLANDRVFDQNIAGTYKRMGEFEKMISKYLDILDYNPKLVKNTKLQLSSVIKSDAEYNIAEKLRIELLIRTQAEPEDRHFQEMLLWLSILEKNYDFAYIQARAIDKKFNEDGLELFNLAQKSTIDKSFTASIKAYNYVIDKGESNSLFAMATMGQLNARLLKLDTDFQKDEAEVNKLGEDFKVAIDKLGKNTNTLNLLRDQAHFYAFHKDNFQSASDLLYEAIAFPGLDQRQIAESKMELADILLFKDEIWDANLIFGQVEKAFKNEPIGHQAKYNRAKLFYYTGDYTYAKVQLDVLRAATSKLIANDAMKLSLIIKNNMSPDSTYVELSKFANAELLEYQGKVDSSLSEIDSLIHSFTTHPIMDDALFLKAKLLLKQGRYSEADASLISLIEFDPSGLLADEALFLRAEIQEEFLHNKQKAMELYQLILSDYNSSVLVVQARNRYRKLRGDKLES